MHFYPIFGLAQASWPRGSIEFYASIVGFSTNRPPTYLQNPGVVELGHIMRIGDIGSFRIATA